MSRKRFRRRRRVSRLFFFYLHIIQEESKIITALLWLKANIRAIVVTLEEYNP